MQDSKLSISLPIERITKAIYENLRATYDLPKDRTYLGYFQGIINECLTNVFGSVIKEKNTMPGLTDINGDYIPIEKVIEEWLLNYGFWYNDQFELLFFYNTGLTEAIDQLDIALDRGPYVLWKWHVVSPYLYIDEIGDYRILEWEKEHLKNGKYIRKADKTIKVKDRAEAYDGVQLEFKFPSNNESFKGSTLGVVYRRLFEGEKAYEKHLARRKNRNT